LITAHFFVLTLTVPSSGAFRVRVRIKIGSFLFCFGLGIRDRIRVRSGAVISRPVKQGQMLQAEAKNLRSRSRPDFKRPNRTLYFTVEML